MNNLGVYICPMHELSVYQTKDSSNTLFHPDLNETYHSRNGALAESLHVFIDAGLKHVATQKQHLRILEIGFGTGLNAILTFEHASKMNLDIEYHALETTPLAIDLIQTLQYDKVLNSAELYQTLLGMHQTKWDEDVQISPQFMLHKHNVALEDFHSELQFDLIYFDAFAPEKQPALWTLEMLQKLHAMQPTSGVWVTYSSKGEVKRNLRSAGYTVERLPGPPFKRHMLRATK